MGFYKGEIQYCSKKNPIFKRSSGTCSPEDENSPEIPMTGKFVDERGVLTPGQCHPPPNTHS